MTLSNDDIGRILADLDNLAKPPLETVRALAENLREERAKSADLSRHLLHLGITARESARNLMKAVTEVSE